MATGVAGAHPAAVFWAFTASIAVPGVFLAYLAVVDRNSIQGGIERPDESVEAGWYDKAASRTLTDLILVLGAVTVVLAFLPVDIRADIKLVLPAVVMFCMVSFGVRYLLQKRQG